MNKRPQNTNEFCVTEHLYSWPRVCTWAMTANAPWCVHMLICLMRCEIELLQKACGYGFHPCWQHAHVIRFPSRRLPPCGRLCLGLFPNTTIACVWQNGLRFRLLPQTWVFYIYFDSNFKEFQFSWSSSLYTQVLLSKKSSLHKWGIAASEVHFPVQIWWQKLKKGLCVL